MRVDGEGGDAALASYAAIREVSQPHRLARSASADACRCASLYVHAGVDSELPLNRQSEVRCCGNAIRKGYSKHTPAPTSFTATIISGMVAIVRRPHNLDTLAWRTGRLTVGILMMTGPRPVDFIVVKGRTAEL